MWLKLPDGSNAEFPQKQEFKKIIEEGGKEEIERLIKIAEIGNYGSGEDEKHDLFDAFKILLKNHFFYAEKLLSIIIRKFVCGGGNRYCSQDLTDIMSICIDKGELELTEKTLEIIALNYPSDYVINDICYEYLKLIKSYAILGDYENFIKIIQKEIYIKNIDKKIKIKNWLYSNNYYGREYRNSLIHEIFDILINDKSIGFAIKIINGGNFIPANRQNIRAIGLIKLAQFYKIKNEGNKAISLLEDAEKAITSYKEDFIKNILNNEDYIKYFKEQYNQYINTDKDILKENLYFIEYSINKYENFLNKLINSEENFENIDNMDDITDIFILYRQLIIGYVNIGDNITAYHFFKKVLGEFPNTKKYWFNTFLIFLMGSNYVSSSKLNLKDILINSFEKDNNKDKNEYISSINTISVDK